MAVWEDTLYVYGGRFGCSQAVSILMSYQLLENTWALVYHNDRDDALSMNYPEGRYSHQMWASDGKLFIFGGRTAGQ